MYAKSLVCARFRGNFLQNGKFSQSFLRLRNAQTQLPHFCVKSFTKRYLFCFETLNNCQSGRKVQNDQILHSAAAKSPAFLFALQKWKFRELLARTLGRLFLFCGKSGFALKRRKFAQKSKNDENGYQKTKKTITFTRVGAMGAKMSFLLQKCGILVIQRFWSQNGKLGVLN